MAKNETKIDCQIPLPIGCQPPFWYANFRCRRGRTILLKVLIYNIFSSTRGAFWMQKCVFSAAVREMNEVGRIVASATRAVSEARAGR